MKKIFSIIIPIYNESENIINLLEEIKFNLKKETVSFEIIIVDDSSIDDSIKIIREYIEKNIAKLTIRLICNKKNYGQSYSIREGVKNAYNSTIVTIDGDGQNNPKDIMSLINYYFSNIGLSLVGGLREKRKDTYLKIISSKIANYIRKNILSDDCDDTGCSLKVFDKKIFLQFPYFSGIHRFLPALFKGYGCKTYFIKVDHRKRLAGISKYGTIVRLFRGIRDIFIVIRIIKKFNHY